MATSTRRAWLVPTGLIMLSLLPVFASRRRWHRRFGRLVIPSGIAAASTGLWMVLFYPRPAVFGERLLAVIQICVASSWILFLLLGFAAIRGGDITRHRAWMTRGYALGSPRDRVPDQLIPVLETR